MKYKTKEVKIPENIKKIFFVGIKGVGMAPLAMIAKDAGISVGGSDVDQEFITDVWLSKKDIQIFSGFDPSSIQSF